MNKLNELKKEIQRLVPEVMEIKMGCKVRLLKYGHTAY